MKKAIDYKESRIVYHGDAETANTAPGVTRRILAYTNELMCVENTFETGAVGALHSHPHTQLTYIVSGKFRFSVGDEVYEVSAGDTLLKREGIIHGCVALEGGVLLDVFTPMREDFLQ